MKTIARMMAQLNEGKRESFEDISSHLLRLFFTPQKSNLTPRSSVFIYRTFFKGINMCFQPFKTSARIYRSFFQG
jgi:hypothetical protein